MRNERIELKENKDGTVTMIRTIESKLDENGLNNEISKVVYEKNQCLEDLKFYKQKYDELVRLENELNEKLSKRNSDISILEKIEEIE